MMLWSILKKLFQTIPLCDLRDVYLQQVITWGKRQRPVHFRLCGGTHCLHLLWSTMGITGRPVRFLWEVSIFPNIFFFCTVDFKVQFFPIQCLPTPVSPSRVSTSCALCVSLRLQACNMSSPVFIGSRHWPKHLPLFPSS